MKNCQYKPHVGGKIEELKLNCSSSNAKGNEGVLLAIETETRARASGKGHTFSYIFLGAFH